MKELEGEKVWRPVGSRKLTGREGITLSTSSTSSTQIKMDGRGTPNLSRNKRGSFPGQQSAEGHQAPASVWNRRNSLPHRQSSSSSSRVRQSSSSDSQGSISPQLFEWQQKQTSPQITVETGREGYTGSEPKEDSLAIIGIANLTLSSSSNKVRRSSSPTSSQGRKTPQLDGSPQMQTSPQSVDTVWESCHVNEPEEGPFDNCRNAKSSLSNKLQKSSSPSLSQKSIKLPEYQQMQASRGIVDAVWEKGHGNELEEGPFNINGIENSHSISSNNFRRSLSPTPSQGSNSPQLVEQKEMQISSEGIVDTDLERGPGSEQEEGPFDICRVVNTAIVKLNKPLHVLNKEKKKELERAKNSSVLKYLRSGMVLLKYSISHIDQVKIVKKCRELGIGLGGFYKPGYKDGAKLHLQMMCLGKDWDPQSRLYRESRLFDNAVPPEIPAEFRNLVDTALHDAHNFLKQSAKSVEEIPKMSPDICIVNFYSSSGKLGLHQDRDEGEESLKKGLPVVSFSIGDSAEFLYSDERTGEAEKVVLESGDVLIFGGKSRHIFHGVSCIKSNTTPKLLVDETNLRPGRLNLTFRQY